MQHPQKGSLAEYEMKPAPHQMWVLKRKMEARTTQRVVQPERKYIFLAPGVCLQGKKMYHTMEVLPSSSDKLYWIEHLKAQMPPSKPDSVNNQHHPPRSQLLH